MNATSKQVTEQGTSYELSNGAALLVRGNFASYVFANGRTYSARTGLHSQTTLIPALRAAAIFDRRALAA
jgi:hypothetical protein